MVALEALIGEAGNKIARRCSGSSSPVKHPAEMFKPAAGSGLDDGALTATVPGGNARRLDKIRGRFRLLAIVGQVELPRSFDAARDAAN